jgi:hypothetical protein
MSDNQEQSTPTTHAEVEVKDSSVEGKYFTVIVFDTSINHSYYCF